MIRSRIHSEETRKVFQTCLSQHRTILHSFLSLRSRFVSVRQFKAANVSVKPSNARDRIQEWTIDAGSFYYASATDPTSPNNNQFYI